MFLINGCHFIINKAIDVLKYCSYVSHKIWKKSGDFSSLCKTESITFLLEIVSVLRTVRTDGVIWSEEKTMKIKDQ